MMTNTKTLIEEDIQAFNNYFDEFIERETANIKPLTSAMQIFKGKQIRPRLGILIAKCFSSLNVNHFDFLISVELIHNASLCHDDVLDEADLRRSQDTFNKIFGNSTAILMGDFLLTLALAKLSDIDNNELNRIFSYAMKQLIQGEIMQNLNLYNLPTIEQYIAKSRDKTAVLFELVAKACTFYINNADEQTKQAVQDFAMYLGILFQIVDDIKNFKSDDGKPILNDLREGVLTLPLIYLAQDYPQIMEIFDKADITDEDVLNVRALLDKYNSLDKAVEFANDYKLNALKNLEFFPENEYKAALAELTQSVFNRI
ncbi:MAG: polyprenyl synthetase family protein [Candidatus Gastranaerophilales bacterium]|nr:polyprenyl synthetase family protein [Candidatus Gastranaerophilales bacterium]